MSRIVAIWLGHGSLVRWLTSSGFWTIRLEVAIELEWSIWAVTSENRSSGFPTRSDTQIRLRRLRKWLEAWNFVFRKERDCTLGQTYKCAVGKKWTTFFLVKIILPKFRNICLNMVAIKWNIDFFQKRYNSVRFCGRYENNKTARGKRARAYWKT